jgi:hypothetical protein
MVSEVATEIDQTLGEPVAVNDRPDLAGQVICHRRWPFSAEKLTAVAMWFDRLVESLKTQGVTAYSSTSWVFAWRDEPPPLRPLASPGGMFGVHLGHPHRITTMFTFRDIEQYLSVKAHLA